MLGKSIVLAGKSIVPRSVFGDVLGKSIVPRSVLGDDVGKSIVLRSVLRDVLGKSIVLRPVLGDVVGKSIVLRSALGDVVVKSIVRNDPLAEHRSPLRARLSVLRYGNDRLADVVSELRDDRSPLLETRSARPSSVPSQRFRAFTHEATLSR